MPEATSAAKEVYLQYAKRKDLTVALIGDYQGYNAVMLQAQDAEGWLRLCEEFGVGKRVNATALDSVRVSSLTSCENKVISDYDSVRNVGEAFAGIIDSLVKEKIRSGNISGSIILDTTYAVRSTAHYDHGKLVDSSSYIDGWMPMQASVQLLQIALQHGNCGYIVHDDSNDLTLWLFFYSNMDEFSQIINNITLTHTQQ